jgi:hypothetical protein
MTLMAGSMKVMQSKEKLAETQGWVEDFSTGQIKSIGVSEILGAVGLILPPLVGVLTWLSPVAAVGILLLMLGAAYTHFRRGENNIIPRNVMLLAMAIFVIYGRFVAEPFA